MLSNYEPMAGASAAAQRLSTSRRPVNLTKNGRF
jgi:hypothetical protein